MVQDIATNIVVKLTVEGIHSWPECPIKEVDYLKFPHRHVFYITCKKHVSHDDRQVEIISFKRQVWGYLNERFFSVEHNALMFGRGSCEQIAKELTKKFSLCYCEVLEDNENGAEVVQK